MSRPGRVVKVPGPGEPAGLLALGAPTVHINRREQEKPRAMDPTAFQASVAAEAPPAGLTPALTALWWDAKGDWARAHEAVAADESGREAAWVHAYLHRVEGDAFNARYWYERARRPVAAMPLAAERDAIVAALLADAGPAA